jgi:putative tryptophan/tyrosine transport system substrate-binding protein
MNRRDLIAMLGGTVIAWPLAGRAQQKAIPVIGMLFPSVIRKAFEQGLRDLGYVEGSNLSIEYRATENPDRIAEFAAELVSLKVDVIAAGGSQAVRAAQQATATVPIVMAPASDPVGSGFVASLARPGGNITGLSLQTPDVSGKRLELLKDVLPGLSRLVVLMNPDDPPALLALKETEVAAQILGIKLQVAEVRSPADFDAAFLSAATMRPQALAVLSAPIMSTNAGLIAEWAVKEGLPSIYPYQGFPQAGGLMSYGPDLDDLVRRAPIYVDKILKGAKPADLPVQQPTKFELVINLKTAKALGLTVPQSLLARADEVIE